MPLEVTDERSLESRAVETEDTFAGTHSYHSHRMPLIRAEDPAMLAELTQAASWLTFLTMWAMAGRILSYRR